LDKILINVSFLFSNLIILKIDKIERMLGNGSSGETYLCKEISTNKLVVLKSSRRKDYLMQEFMLQKKINSKFVVSVLEVFEAYNWGFLVMEYCCGGTLQDIINRNEKIPKEVLYSYCK
jgi:serine/threonine protein kinase